MNRYPVWINLLILSILLLGSVLALPNIYGSAPAVQLANIDGSGYNESRLPEIVRILEADDLGPEAAYVDDGRAVLRFHSVEEQQEASLVLGERLQREASVALTLAPKLPAWLREFGLQPMSLGLDLRGGVHFLLEVDMDSALTTRLEAYRESLSDLLLVMDGSDPRTFRVRMSDQQIRDRQDFAIEQNIVTLRNRVNQLGVSEPLVQRQGVDRIVVQLPGVQDPNRLDDILTATATLEFRLVDTAGDSPGSRRYPGRTGEASQVLKREVIASGDQIIDAEAGFSEGSPAVFIGLDASGGEKMLSTTQANLKKPMSTVFIESRRIAEERDGETVYRTERSEEIINTATIQGIFKDRFQITGLTPGEARDLSLLLRAGALAAPVYKIEERTIGPSLGRDNIERGFNAVKIGFLAVIVFMAIYYRGFGLIANVALLANLVFIVSLLSLLQASLTLPGIAGIVLTVGMAVDANVLIFERIREELSAGSTAQNAINSGYEKALSSIADANVTTLIAAIVLFAFGTGPIKGFAITLSLGIITSMFTAIIGTRAIVNLVFGGRKTASLPI